MILLIFFFLNANADKIIAKVGDNVILKNELDEASLYFSLQLGMNRSDLRERILEEAINRQLILIEAEKESITVEPEEIENMLENTIENVIRRFPSYEEFEAALKTENLTVEELKNRSRKDAREKALVEKLIASKIRPTISISPTELKKFYDLHKDSVALKPTTVKVKHILLYIKWGEETIRETAKRIYEIKKLLDYGAEFATLAKEFSEDENSRARGGMLGKIKRGETFEEFEKAVWHLKPGEISEPFQTRYGFHIVDVLSRDKESMLLRQILIKVKITQQDSLRTKNLAYQIQKRIKDGESFDELAEKYSDDPQIDLGEYVEDQISPPYNEIVKKLPVRTPNDPFLSPIGYHIFYVEERTPAKILAFEEIRDNLYEYLYQLKLSEKFDQLIVRLKKEVFVEILE